MAFPISWNRKHSITIDKTKCSGSVSNFPVLITEANLLAEVFTLALSTGADIRFSSDAGGQTQLPFEIVNFDVIGLKAEIWVKVAGLSSADDVTIYIWYANSGAVALAAADTYGQYNVWDSNFKGVWHGHVNVSDQLLDSTVNVNHLDLNSGGIYSQITGKVGEGIELDPDDYFDKGSALSAVTDNFTLESLVIPFNNGQGLNAVMHGEGPAGGVGLQQGNAGGGGGNHLTFLHGGVGWVDSAGRFTDTTTWRHAAVVVSGADTGYLDGVSQGGGSLAKTSPTNFVVGNDRGGRQAIGKQDEIRFSITPRTGAWLLTAVNNMMSPGTFAVAGSASVGVPNFFGGNT